VRPVEQIMAAFNVVHRSHTRFVAEGRGQDFADLVDELLSGTSQGSYDAVAAACILGLSKPPLPMTSPAAHASWTFRSVRCWTTPADCGTSTRKEAHRKLRPTLLSPPCSA
jgi:hypothetical protein